MSRPWEDTVVLALRDIQWIDANDGQASVPALPDLCLKLDGNTEKTLGDLIFQQGEKFYLFEVKSARGNISSEWNKSTGGKRKPKKAYEVLSALVEAWVQDKKTWNGVLVASLKCHHFVYWSDGVFDANDTFGNIMVEPYVSGAMAKGGEPDSNKGTLMPVCDPPFEVGVSDGAGAAYKVSEMLPFSALRGNQAYVIKSGNGVSGSQQAVFEEPFGADLYLFKKYLQFLCKHAGEGGEIRAIVCSSHDRLTKMITSIEQLEKLLEPSGVPASKALPKRLKTRTVLASKKSARPSLSNVVAFQTQMFPSLPNTGIAARLRLRPRPRP